MPIEGSTVDLALHLITVVAAAGLFAVSFRAYRRKGSQKFLFVCAAFGLFAVKELLVATTLFWATIPAATAVAHLLNLAILITFFYGVVR